MTTTKTTWTWINGNDEGGSWDREEDAIDNAEAVCLRDEPVVGVIDYADGSRYYFPLRWTDDGRLKRQFVPTGPAENAASAAIFEAYDLYEVAPRVLSVGRFAPEVEPGPSGWLVSLVVDGTPRAYVTDLDFEVLS